MMVAKYSTEKAYLFFFFLNEKIAMTTRYCDMCGVK